MGREQTGSGCEGCAPRAGWCLHGRGIASTPGGRMGREQTGSGCESRAPLAGWCSHGRGTLIGDNLTGAAAGGRWLPRDWCEIFLHYVFEGLDA